MCGVAGFSGNFARMALECAGSAMAHRGPDGHGQWLDGEARVGLAHRRLSIIDLSSSGAQPMASPDGRVVLSYNGEIYNYRELRAQLEARGWHFRGTSDTEVLLNMYLAYGEAMLGQLNGIFAFALWDRQTRSILVARDALGVKPLYLAESAKGVAFASEIKALLELTPELRDVDVVSLHRYLTYLWCPGNGTPLRGVRKLGPGEAAIVRDGRIERQWQWYRLPLLRDVQGTLSEGESRAGTVENLRRAVHRQMVADVPVGAFLSGGLDSSAVVAFAREVSPDIRCFTIESVGLRESGVEDDLPFARKVASHLGVPLEVVRVDGYRMSDDLQAMVAQLDEPLADPAALNILYMSRVARDQGMKVMLSGAGGDDLFCGYRRHVAVNYLPTWQWLPRGLRKALEHATAMIDQTQSMGRRAARLFAGAELDGDRRLAAYFAWAREEELAALYSPAFRAAVGAERADRPMIDFLGHCPPGAKPLDRTLALEQRFFMADHNLVYTDKMSMAAGVEVRVPFLDTDLVEFAATVPVGLKQKGRSGKWILKRAMEPFLPKYVIERPKTGFGVPLRQWVVRELEPIIRDLLSAESLRRRGFFEPAAVSGLIERNRSGRIDAAYLLLSLLAVELWCRRFVDAKTQPGGNG